MSDRPAVVDETNGPGLPLSYGGNLAEIWSALGHADGRTPSLDEVLMEIRLLRRVDGDPEPVHDVPEFLDEEEDEHNLCLRSVTFGTFGVTITGYSADDVLKIRRAYMEGRTH